MFQEMFNVHDHFAFARLKVVGDYDDIAESCR